MERFNELFAFSPKQAKYFRTLVDYNQAEDPALSQKLLSQLMKQNQATGRVLEEGSYDYYSHWRHGVVRAMLDVMDFDGGDYGEMVRICS